MNLTAKSRLLKKESSQNVELLAALPSKKLVESQQALTLLEENKRGSFLAAWHLQDQSSVQCIIITERKPMKSASFFQSFHRIKYVFLDI